MCALRCGRPGTPHARRARALALTDACTRSRAADGMLIYKLLGDEAQQSFARSWGISYGLNSASEWKARARGVLGGAAQRVFVFANNMHVF
jgi:hypothetical protein